MSSFVLCFSCCTFLLILAKKALRLFITSVCVSKVLFPVESSSGREESSWGLQIFLHVSKDKMYFCFLVWLLRKTLLMHPFKLFNIISPVLILFPVLISMISITFLNCLFDLIAEPFGLCFFFDTLSFYGCMFSSPEPKAHR